MRLPFSICSELLLKQKSIPSLTSTPLPDKTFKIKNNTTAATATATPTASATATAAHK